jgi:hypothetical protein
MPIVSLVSPPVLFVRWTERCEAADVEQIKALTEEAHAQIGAELVYVSLIPQGCKPPDTEARAALREGTEHASEHCRSIHIVIEGQGLRRALIRSISAGLLLATRKTSRGFHIHETLDQALEASGLPNHSRSALLNRLQNAEMLS